MFQNGPNIINEETILNSPEIQIQKEYAKIQFGDKFVTKGKLPKELQKEVRCEKIRVSILAVIGILFFSYFLSNIVLWKKHEIIHLLNIELGGVNSSPSVGWLLLSFVGILSFLTLGFASTDYSLLVSNINKCKKDAMNFGKIYVPYFIKRNYKKLSTRDIYINWISFSVYVIGGISVWILCWLNDQSKYDSQTGRLLVSFFWMDIKPPVYYFNRDQQVLINVIFLVGTLILQIYTIVDARMRKQNIISLYQAEIIDQDEINLLRKKANKICLILLIIFLAILFILFFIIYFVSKRTKKIVNKGENGGFLKNVGHFFGRKP
ncbi:MSC_0882 family membrane protein [Spiroplasma endosymbiont of Aspidapion aeneum]|uniref:MSC_0882 family membrane protein n=1 Tax=Spiroplasma endosymbiont of Aspidapion aeneum TaxID=3066276 RepID=UPI00313D5A67